MTQYLIREENMERLEKKLAAIEKKCKASHCSFSYEVVGDEFQEATDNDGNKYVFKYKVVQVEGTAKYNGWRFVATLDHHAEGNVIRAYDTELTIPDKYKSCGPTCEHCNKIRSRKDTYLIFNEETNEFKQVGKACLQEFTNGLSSENIAFFCSIYEKMEEGFGYSGTSSNRYIFVEDILRYAFECYKHWGYNKSRNSIAEELGYIPTGYRSTVERVTDYYYINRAASKMREEFQAEMDEVGFDANSKFAVETTSLALVWIQNISEDELRGNEYLRNLHVICSDEYTEYRSLGILVSLTVAYMRHIEKVAAYKKKQKAQEEEKAASDYVGEIGKRITVNCSSFTCISSWSTIYGMTYLYKFTDESGNVFIWYASNSVEHEDRVKTITGTVKDHSEFNGTKQTVLTRCKAVLRSEAEEEHAPGSTEVQKALDDFFEYVDA